MKRVDTEPVVQAFWHGWQPDDVCGRHDLLHPSPSRRTAPFPDPLTGQSWIALTLSEIKGVIELSDRGVRQWDLPEDDALAALQCDDVRYAGLDVDRSWREREDFGNAASA